MSWPQYLDNSLVPGGPVCCRYEAVKTLMRLLRDCSNFLADTVDRETRVPRSLSAFPQARETARMKIHRPGQTSPPFPAPSVLSQQSELQGQKYSVLLPHSFR